MLKELYRIVYIQKLKNIKTNYCQIAIIKIYLELDPFPII